MWQSCENWMYCGLISCFFKWLASVKWKTEDQLSSTLNRCNSCTTKTDSKVAASTRTNIAFWWIKKYEERTRSCS